MNKDTYEEKDINSKLETYEWDDIWVIHANDEKKHRVLLIGDSISRGYRHKAAEALSCDFYVDNYATSKGIDNPALIKTISLVLAQQPQYKVIHFNNGLHGFHLSDEEYEEHFEGVIKFLTETYPDKKLIIGLTTPAREKDNTQKLAERNDRVIARNRAAVRVAEKYGILVNDLYAPLDGTNKYHCQDGIHLIEEGYALLAEKIKERVYEVLK